jgi:predicted HicB family RNase H-like nuclease
VNVAKSTSPDPKPDDIKYIQVIVPTKLHTEAKILAVRLGITLPQLVENAISEYVKTILRVSGGITDADQRES